ncbi:MAG: hypothetical protein M9921_14705 [Fimbriimonadaceae bacterium]|nr:hypothetical protein [Fimbriimonadaceae bacterium]
MEPQNLVPTLACLFFAAAFLQSSLDKLFDRQGNLEFLQGHFAKTPLARFVPAMLLSVTVMEFASGVLCLVGAASLWFFPGDWATVGLGLAATTLLMLFTGQRIAKDYVGAAVLAGYFAVALIGLAALPLAVGT